MVIAPTIPAVPAGFDAAVAPLPSVATPPVSAAVMPAVSASTSAAQVARYFEAAVLASLPTTVDAPSTPAESPADDTPLALGASTGAGSSASAGTGGGGATAATADHGALSFALTLLARGGDVDDDLPGIPVYDTDASPD